MPLAAEEEAEVRQAAERAALEKAAAEAGEALEDVSVAEDDELTTGSGGALDDGDADGEEDAGVRVLARFKVNKMDCVSVPAPSLPPSVHTFMPLHVYIRATAPGISLWPFWVVPTLMNPPWTWITPRTAPCDGYFSGVAVSMHWLSPPVLVSVWFKVVAARVQHHHGLLATWYPSEPLQHRYGVELNCRVSVWHCAHSRRPVAIHQLCLLHGSLMAAHAM